jgi:hypothetical protein
MRIEVLWACLVFSIAVMLVLGLVSRAERWTPDGFSYARMAMEDAGVTPVKALKIAEDFYLATPVGYDPKYRIWFTADARHAAPAAGPIFRTRVFYPWVVSLIYPWRGLAALTDVSAAAYVIGTLSLYWLLLAFARAWVAASGAVAFAASPIVLWLAESDLTDMLALALWIIALAGVFYFLRRPVPLWAVVFGLASLALALTRQAIYLPLGAVAGALVSALIRRDGRDTISSLILVAITTGITAANLVWNALLHGVGPRIELGVTHLLAIRNGSVALGTPLEVWYRQSLVASIIYEIKRSIHNVIPVLAIAAMLWDSRRKEVAVLIGASIAGLAPIFLDPTTYALPRILEAPLYPVALAALAIGTERLLQSRSAA